LDGAEEALEPHPSSSSSSSSKPSCCNDAASRTLRLRRGCPTVRPTTRAGVLVEQPYTLRNRENGDVGCVNPNNNSITSCVDDDDDPDGGGGTLLRTTSCVDENASGLVVVVVVDDDDLVVVSGSVENARTEPPKPRRPFSLEDLLTIPCCR